MLVQRWFVVGGSCPAWWSPSVVQGDTWCVVRERSWNSVDWSNRLGPILPFGIWWDCVSLSGVNSRLSFDCRCRSVCGTRTSSSHLCLWNVVLSWRADAPVDDHQELSRVILGLSYANDPGHRLLDRTGLAQFHLLDLYGIVYLWVPSNRVSLFTVAVDLYVEQVLVSVIYACETLFCPGGWLRRLMSTHWWPGWFLVWRTWTILNFICLI